MKVTVFVMTFLTVTIQASNNPETDMQVSSAAQNNQGNVKSVTSGLTNLTDQSIRPSTNFSEPTFAPTAVSTKHSGLPSTSTTTTSMNNKNGTHITKPASIVGVAYATTRAEFEAEKSTSYNASGKATVPIVIIGCLVGVLGVVAATVIVKKHKVVIAEAKGEREKVVEVEEEEEEETNYSNAIHTPGVTKTTHSHAITTSDAVEDETNCFDDINGHAI
ncbi:unnamed protein product [Peronospora belbahrii]|uniref:Mid2 domain-containing protein n=1 Tax=Peronospora belbahrii TaxID=622444 RepID=A0AAU9KUX1_9STRA|nr:unnamed protein product [Peronospora belbahrii]CAH0518722.1 unnamed protein product [Peronospora belbahrii]